MNIYEANLSFFKTNAPQLYEILEHDSPLCTVEIEESDSNNCILSANGTSCFMHSVYDIENEIQMMFKNIENDVETIVLFGVGNGYALEYIARNYKNLKSLIVIEPSLEIFKRFLKLYDCQQLFSNKWSNEINITFAVNKDELFISRLTVQEGVRGSKNAWIKHVYVMNVFSDYFEKINSSLSKQLKLTLGSFATVSWNWKLWHINSVRNLKQEGIIPIESISDIFKDKTVVIVSAGPSLNKNMHLINKLKEKAIVLAVGSAIKVLDSNGIVPHFRVAIDAHPGEKEVVKVKDTNEAILMFSNQLYSDVVKEYEGSKIRYILDTDFLGKYIYKKSGLEYIEFKSGPSVANGALDLVCALKCKRVIFMGQDLSYTEEGLYARGTTTAFKDEEQAWLDSQEYQMVENIYGEKVYAIHSLLQMKYIMEQTVDRYPEIEFLNATEGGLGIDGAYNLTANEVLENKLTNEENIDVARLDSILNNSDVKNDYAKKINTGLEIMESELEEVVDIQKDIIKFLLKIEKMKNRNLNKVENELIYIEKLKKDISENSFYRDVVEMGLRVDLFSLGNTYRYTGNDKAKAIEAKEKIFIGVSNKVSEYIELSLELMNE